MVVGRALTLRWRRAARLVSARVDARNRRLADPPPIRVIQASPYVIFHAGEALGHVSGSDGAGRHGMDPGLRRRLTTLAKFTSPAVSDALKVRNSGAFRTP